MPDNLSGGTSLGATDRPGDGTVKPAVTCAVGGHVINLFAGPRRVRMRVPIPVRVLWAVRPWSSSITAPWDPLARKRSLYWHNRWRNSAIVAVAAAFVAGDRATLRNYGLFDDKRLPRLADGRPARVAILAESPEHGRLLVGLLDNWHLLHQGISGVWPGSGGQTPDREDANQAGVDRAVVTWKGARCLDTFDVDVLIRVDGTPWPLNVPAFPPAGSAELVYLVDFSDFDDVLAIYSNEWRLRDYVDRGWLTTRVPARPEPDLLMGGRK
jgi:hypothetical protein